MATYGIEKLFAARQTQDTSAGLVYDTPRYLSLVQEMSIKPKFNDDSAYAENRMIDQASEFDSAAIGINRYEMLSSEQAYLTGQDISAAGGVIAASGDAYPNIALLYRTPLRRKVNGIAVKRYGVVYCVNFTPPDQDMKSLQGKPDLSQVPQMTGTAMPTAWSYTNGAGQEKHPWEYHIDSDDPNCPANIDSTWFSGVYIPGISAVPALTLSSSVPANNATSVAAGASPTLTFSNPLANYGGIVLLKASDMSIVSTALSVDGTGKIVTVDPTASLASATQYRIVIAGVTDINGQTLSATVGFTTA